MLYNILYNVNHAVFDLITKTASASRFPPHLLGQDLSKPALRPPLWDRLNTPLRSMDLPSVSFPARKSIMAHVRPGGSASHPPQAHQFARPSPPRRCTVFRQ